MPTINKEIIWITGASTGIGRELAIQLAQQGNTVVVSARNKQGLEDLCLQHKNMVPIVFDVTNENLLEIVRDQLRAVSPYLDRVVLNAGHCEYLDVKSPDWQMMRRVMEVNYLGAINSLAVAMPLLRSRPGGNAHIVGVVSLATLLAFPKAEAYGSSKAALQYFLDSLRVDLAAENIDVTVINPGFVATPLTAKNNFSMPFMLSVEDAASRMIDCIKRRPRQFDFPARLKWSLKLLAYMPALWNRWIAPALSR
jgi:short-subunit dehydrogenase